jgi:hypothetical protein
MESYGLISFREQAALPPMENMQAYANGTAMNNVDGKSVRGGRICGGTAGYQLASMGAPGGQCAAFPLYGSQNSPYELYGWKLVTNWHVLKTNPGL